MSLLPRAMYYVSRAISEQKNITFKGEEYHKLIKVYGVWFCMVLNEEENALNYYEMQERRVLGNHKEKEVDYDKGCVVMIRLANEESKDVLDAFMELFSRGSNIEAKLKYLKKEYGIDLKGKEREVETMCTPEEFFEAKYKAKYKKIGLLEGREEGRALGLAEGREEGRAEGRAEGRVEGRMTSLISCVENLMETLSLPIETIMDMLKMNEEEKEACKKAILH